MFEEIDGMRKPDRMQFEFEDLSVNVIMQSEDFYQHLLPDAPLLF